VAELDSLKAQAEVYRAQLARTVDGFGQAEITARLNAISGEIRQLGTRVSELLGGLNLDGLEGQVRKVQQEADQHFHELKQSYNRLGYGDLISTNERLKSRVEGYRKLAYDMLVDFEFMMKAHASEYAGRRRGDLLKALKKLDEE